MLERGLFPDGLIGAFREKSDRVLWVGYGCGGLQGAGVVRCQALYPLWNRVSISLSYLCALGGFLLSEMRVSPDASTGWGRKDSLFGFDRVEGFDADWKHVPRSGYPFACCLQYL